MTVDITETTINIVSEVAIESRKIERLSFFSWKQLNNNEIAAHSKWVAYPLIIL